MNLRQKAAKSVAWSALENLGTQAIYFVLFLLLARLLEPEVFGLVSLAGVFISFMMVFADQGLSDAIIQRQELEAEHLDTVFWTNLGIGVLLTLISIAAAEQVSLFFKQPQLTPVIGWLSLSFLFNAFSSVQQALLRRQLAFRALAVRSLVAIALGGIVGVTMAYMGYGVWSLVGQQLVNRLVAVLALWWASDWRPGLKVSVKHFKELFSFGINILASSLLIFFSVRSDDFLIGYFLGPVALGYYTIAYRLLVAMTQIFSATIRQVALPMFSRLQNEKEQLQRALYKTTQLVSFIAFPAFLGTVVLAPEIVQSLFGKQWMPSIPVMQFLALTGITHSVLAINGLAIVAMGKPSWDLTLIFINTAFNVIGFAIAVRWGIVAVAAAAAIRSYVLAPLTIWAMSKLTPINISHYLAQFAAPLGGALSMATVILVAKYLLSSSLNSYALLTSCVILGTLIYTTVILLIAPNLIRQIIDLLRSTLVVAKQKT